MLFEGGIGVPNLFGLLAKSPNKLGNPTLNRRSTSMAQVKVFYDRAGNTLTVWFSDPAR
jgi:hypothetical protein